MSTDIRFILASFSKRGSNDISENPLLKNSEFIFNEASACFFINEKYKTGIPQRIIWHGNLGIVLHGIVFPKTCSIDYFSQNPDLILKSILEKHALDPENIPYEFINGAYVGFVIDKKNNHFYAFTSFLNSIPLYYFIQDERIIVSTDYNRIAKISGKILKSVTTGLIEYYHLGTNLSEHTAIDGIFSIPKGAYIRFDGQNIKKDYYYILPSDEMNISFDDAVSAFDELWKKNLAALESDIFKFGLGFTGGIDSRLIFAGWPKRDKLITFTGDSPGNPDYILAHYITEKIGLGRNHFLEDYTRSAKLKGYVEVLKMTDNPLFLNSGFFIDQFEFRKRMGFTYELIGLTELLGGVYHYTSRSSLKWLIKTSFPVRRLTNIQNADSYFEILRLGVRGNMFDEIHAQLSSEQKDNYDIFLKKLIALIKVQINAGDVFETFIERFRHIHKMSNLLTWSRLPGRSYDELLSPSMNISLTDFVSRIPLRHRDQRKLLISWFNRYSPEFARFVLSGSVFTPNAPWIFHKIFNSYIKSLNALGHKIPYLQRHNNQNKQKMSLEDLPELSRFQQAVCEDSEFLRSNFFGDLHEKHKDHKLRRWRLFNIAALEKRINLSDDKYEQFLFEKYDEISQRSKKHGGAKII